MLMMPFTAFAPKASLQAANDYDRLNVLEEVCPGFPSTSRQDRGEYARRQSERR